MRRSSVGKSAHVPQKQQDGKRHPGAYGDTDAHRPSAADDDHGEDRANCHHRQPYLHVA
jgi:hypothetical protein